MSGPNPSLPAGAQGVSQRDLQLQNLLTEPLTPDEMWRQAVQSQRGFQSSRSGPADALRSQPATIPPDAQAGDKGVRVGKGFETFAGIQMLDKDGRRVAFGADFFDKGGADNHAEARIVRGLEKHSPPTLPDGKLIVVVETDCCPSCETRLREFAQKRAIKEIEIHVPERESLRQAGKMVSPKTASATSLQNTGKTTTIKRLRSISLPRPLMPAAPATSRTRTAVVGTVAGLGAGIALGILQAKMKDEMLKSLEQMPKPKADPRDAPSFFADPNTGKSLRFIDLLGKKLKPFGKELEEHHAKVVAGTNLEIVVLAVSKLAHEERLEFLHGVEDQLHAYVNDLNVVFDNLEAAKGLSNSVLESAKGAEQLAGAVSRLIVMDLLLKAGLSFEEIVALYDNLKDYAAQARRVFQDVDAVHAQVQRLLQEANTLASQVNKVYWSVVLGRISDELKKRGLQP
jgi:hypothetical protein